LRLYRNVQPFHQQKQINEPGNIAMTITRRNVLLGATAAAALAPIAARAQTSEVVIGVIYPL